MRNPFFRIILFIGIAMTAHTSLQAQHYHGKFRHQPHLNEFNHLIIIQNPKQNKNIKALSVKAIANSGELWHSKATPSDVETSKALIEKFGANIKIKSVYSLSIPYEEEIWQYYLLEYKNSNREYVYLLVEGLQDELENRKAVDVHVFDTGKITASL